MSSAAYRPRFGYDIRISQDAPRLTAKARRCAVAGCQSAAELRVPKDRHNMDDKHWLCRAHIRERNERWNFFAGMSDDAVARFQKDAITGHRPTWKMGSDGRPRGSKPDPAQFHPGYGAADPFNMFAELGGPSRPRPEPEREDRTVRNAERKALDVLGLEGGVKTPEIKARFKLLVKRHHPDANGGDRSCEDKLREIIQAYNYLKSVGYC